MLNQIRNSVSYSSVIFWCLCVLVSVCISCVGYNITTWQWWLSIVGMNIGYILWMYVKVYSKAGRKVNENL